MSKPSMFSKNYNKEIKKRRRKIALLIIMPIIGLTIFLITNSNVLINKGINNILLNKPKDKEISRVEVEKKPQVVKPESNSENPKVEGTLKAPDALKSEVFSVSLSDDQKITIECSVSGTEKNIKGVTDDKNISYDISPSKKSIVIQSKNNQDLLYVDVNKISKDITKKVYESTKGKVFSKEELLKTKKNYVWSIMPKFIDEDNIAYVSELPWINQDAVQHIWKVNLKSNVHIQVKEAFGKNITFEKITSKGLDTLVDGKVMYVTSDGGVIE